jgi:hypothetical protein
MSGVQGCKKKDGNELEPAMDDLINAGSGNGRFRCFRDPPTLYFGNDKIRQYRPFSISHPELSLIELIQNQTIMTANLTFQMDVYVVLFENQLSAASYAPQTFSRTLHTWIWRRRKCSPHALE